MPSCQVLMVTLLSVVCLSTVLARSVQEHTRWRRSPTVDQRLSEIQALLALGHGGDVGHGMFDPEIVGKRKRGGPPSMVENEDGLTSNQRIQLLKAMMGLLSDYQS